MLFLKTLEVNYIWFPSFFIILTQFGRLWNRKHIFFTFYVEKRKNQKHSFWLQIVIKSKLEYYFWKLYRLIIYGFHHSLSPQISLEGSTIKSTFFFSILCGKHEKTKNTVFGYKKWSKIKLNIIFENFRGQFYIVSILLYHPKSVWKTLQSKAHFSLAFYTEKLKNTVFGYKKWSKTTLNIIFEKFRG